MCRVALQNLALIRLCAPVPLARSQITPPYPNTRHWRPAGLEHVPDRACRGRHIQEDIPALVAAAAAKHPTVRCRLADPIGVVLRTVTAPLCMCGLVRRSFIPCLGRCAGFEGPAASCTPADLACICPGLDPLMAQLIEKRVAAAADLHDRGRARGAMTATVG